MSGTLGLSDSDVGSICTILSQYQDVEEARIFGSRAKGSYKQGSDIDISLNGKNLSLRIAAAIQEKLNEETILPYRFDVLWYESIESEDLREHIDRVGKVLYKKEF